MYRLIKITSLIMLIALLSLFAPSPSSAFVVCQVTNTSYNYPNQANPGQQVQFSVTLSGACNPSDTGYYSARVDLVDMANTILTSNSGAMSYAANNGAPFTITISDHLNVPATSGLWNLQYVVYVFVSNGSGIETDYKAVKSITLQIGTVVQSVANSTSTSSTYSSSSAIIPPQTIASNSSSAQSIPSLAQTTGPSGSPENLYISIAVTFAALFVIAMALYVREKRNKTKGDNLGT
jgi:hypothetical protein